MKKWQLLAFRNKIYYSIRVRFNICVELFQKHCPVKIAREFPVSKLCGAVLYDSADNEYTCDRPMSIKAYNTGDGWLFFWECDEESHECTDMEDNFIDKWYPFMFGVWCTAKDLRRIGIEVV